MRVVTAAVVRRVEGVIGRLGLSGLRVGTAPGEVVAVLGGIVLCRRCGYTNGRWRTLLLLVL